MAKKEDFFVTIWGEIRVDDKVTGESHISKTTETYEYENSYCLKYGIIAFCDELLDEIYYKQFDSDRFNVTAMIYIESEGKHPTVKISEFYMKAFADANVDIILKLLVSLMKPLNNRIDQGQKYKLGQRKQKQMRKIG